MTTPIETSLLPMTCTECGMLCDLREFHPFAACLMFKGCHDGDKVRANLGALADRASRAGQAGAGWVLVPRKATTAQRLAMSKADDESGDRYRLMAEAFIAAAPTPPSAAPPHTDDENFEHFLSYSNLRNEPPDVLEKMRRAFDANSGPSAAPQAVVGEASREKTTIGLDYDGTITRDPDIWHAVMRLMQSYGHEVHIVTMRHGVESTMGHAPMEQRFLDDADGVHFTGNSETGDRDAKRPHMDAKGIEVHVWIDDNPEAVHMSAREIWGWCTQPGDPMLHSAPKVGTPSPAPARNPQEVTPMFCKIFGEGDSQILLVRSVDENGKPIVNLTYEGATYVSSDSCGLICIRLTFDTLEQAQAALEQVNEEEARETVAEWNVKLAETLAHEAKQIDAANGS